MPGSVQALKKSIRSNVRETVRGVDARSRAEASARAVELLLEQKEWREAKSILLYVPREDELDLRGCLGPARVAGKLVALPRYLPDQSIYCAAVYQGGAGRTDPGAFWDSRTARECPDGAAEPAGLGPGAWSSFRPGRTTAGARQRVL